MKHMSEIEKKNEQSDSLFLARLAAEEHNLFARRLIAGLTAVLLLWLAALLYFKQNSLQSLWQTPQSKVQVESLAVAPGINRADELNRELTRLKRQLGTALTQTLSIKLEELEQRIRLGRAGLQDLELIQSIRQDIQALAKHSHSSLSTVQPKPMVVVSSPSEVASLPVAAQSEPVVLAKIAHLENLLYLGLASIALVTVAAAGYWLHCGARLRRLDADVAQMRYRLEHHQQ